MRSGASVNGFSMFLLQVSRISMEQLKSDLDKQTTVIELASNNVNSLPSKLETECIGTTPGHIYSILGTCSIKVGITGLHYFLAKHNSLPICSHIGQAMSGSKALSLTPDFGECKIGGMLKRQHNVWVFKIACGGLSP